MSDITENNRQDFIQYNFQDLPSEKILKEKKLIPQNLPFEIIVKQSKKVFQTDIFRTIWKVKYRESSFTVCFDKGKIICRTHEQLVNEIEIEVQQDEKNLLLEFFGNLWSKLPNSFYQGRSKALRGFELSTNPRLPVGILKKPKTLSTISFQKIKIELLSTISVLDYVSCSFCENGGKSPANCLRNSLLELKAFMIFVFGISNIFNKKQLRDIMRNIHRMERVISSEQEKRDLLYPVNLSQLYKTHTDLLLSLHKFSETLKKFSGLNR